MSASTSSQKPSQTPPAAPIRCLVIQLTRLGDTLQSLMALRAAKQLYPQLEIHFLAREKFAAAAQRVPWIEKVYTLPTEELLRPILGGQRTTQETLGDLARWTRPLVELPWDLVINWSYSESSSFLTGLLPAKIKLGYTRRKDRTFAAADGWSHYVQGIVQGGVHQNIHLTDIFTTQLLTALQIHFGDPADEGDAPVTSKAFFKLELGEREMAFHDPSRKWVGIQLGAGSEAKTWSPANWAALARLILDKHPECSLALLGGPGETAKAHAFMERLQPSERDRTRVISLVGETEFDLWASVIGRCHWLFSGDTAAVHLASVLGTRVFNLSIGPVRAEETGPYGNGHYVLAARKGADGQVGELSPDAVYATWSYAASEWAHRRQIQLENHLAQIGQREVLDGVRLARSRIRNSSDGGGVVYESLIRRPLTLDEWTSMVMGHTARSWYCGWTPPIGSELARDRIGPELLRELRRLEECTGVLTKICEEASRTATALNQRSLKLKSDRVMGLRDRDELRELGKKLIELDQLIERMGRTQAPLHAFSQMSKVLMHNLRSTQLAEMGKETADCYRQLGEGVRIMGDWLRHTTGLVKPVAIPMERPTL